MAFTCKNYNEYYGDIEVPAKKKEKTKKSPKPI